MLCQCKEVSRPLKPSEGLEYDLIKIEGNIGSIEVMPSFIRRGQRDAIFIMLWPIITMT